MKDQRKPFMPLDADIDDRIETLARDKGVGTLERSIPPAATAGEGMQLHSAATGANDSSEAVAKVPAKLKTVNLELPDYVWTELKIRAAHQQTTLKHVIMKALVKEGFSIEAKDMIEDGRRLRGVGASARGR
jgi:hypothetical protein